MLRRRQGRTITSSGRDVGPVILVDCGGSAQEKWNTGADAFEAGPLAMVAKR